MRMSDWSSDVRSSELGKLAGAERHVGQLRLQFLRLDQLHAEIDAENCQREQHQEDRPGEDVEAVEVHRLVEVRLDAVGQDVADHQRRARVAVAAHVERHDAEERSEEHTSELQSLMRISYAVFCLNKKKTNRK